MLRLFRARLAGPLPRKGEAVGKGESRKGCRHRALPEISARRTNTADAELYRTPHRRVNSLQALEALDAGWVRFSRNLGRYRS